VRGPCVMPRAELHEVAGTARLRTQTHARLLPPAERLALDDGTGDPPVHVHVAGLDTVEPCLHLRRVERVDAAGEAEIDCVLHLHRLLKRARPHEAEHRAEDLREMEVRTGGHTRLDAG